jgi:hypothetical protein
MRIRIAERSRAGDHPQKEAVRITPPPSLIAPGLALEIGIYQQITEGAGSVLCPMLNPPVTVVGALATYARRIAKFSRPRPLGCNHDLLPLG